ncbi:Gamma-butyrobetaine hydroxylase [Marinomonas sp. MED121]|uniref:TauD/TfdA family dioxygenase n=1 Tax=Marinomonas sp. MED121 TaxID=314277 RepID=UPI0000690EFB|nr:TauD/TfdA family dioxygenase [Marinomonas sp. MED121]EAQ64271.1 Gamma-butyrobetaine hydroxylase [Marinomonas sp. MED121]
MPISVLKDALSASVQAQLDSSLRMLVIHWNESETSYFPYVWLRDNDPAGFHPDTQERQFDLTTINLDDDICEFEIDQETIRLSWLEEAYTAEFRLAWLYENQPGKMAFDPVINDARLWRSELSGAEIPRSKATEILTQDSALLAWLRDTQAYGLSIVEGLADDVKAGTQVAKKVGFLRETNFGVEFEVKSKPKPNNLAYTSIALPLHTDLTNQELPPGYQFLHCLTNDAQGGGSIFCDGFAVAEDLRRADIVAFDLLVNTQIPCRFHDEDYDIRSRKAVINLDDQGQVNEICFNPHLASTLDISPELMQAYYRAYQTFMKMTKNPEYKISVMLTGGEMVVFDNRRVLHGRDAFDPQSGARYLHGCYVDRGEFESRLRVLSR